MFCVKEMKEKSLFCLLKLKVKKKQISPKPAEEGWVFSGEFRSLL